MGARPVGREGGTRPAESLALRLASGRRLVDHRNYQYYHDDDAQLRRAHVRAVADAPARCVSTVFSLLPQLTGAGPASSSPANASGGVPERYTVAISHPPSDARALFKTRAGHLVGKVLGGACRAFAIDYAR